jgi:hypothetical protein
MRDSEGRRRLRLLVVRVGSRQVARVVRVHYSLVWRWSVGERAPSERCKHELERRLGIPRWSWLVKPVS